MKHWWVNHNQTFRQEFRGGYVWCPKRRTDGHRHHFYETVRAVRRGDLVISYAQTAAQGFGFAQTQGYSCPQPDEFGKVGEAWDKRGWRADVIFRLFPRPLRTADHADMIAPLLPNQYSPLQRNGFGNQAAYFSEISKELALCVISLADPIAHQLVSRSVVSERAAKVDEGLPVITEWEDRLQRVVENNQDLTPTTRTALVQSRRGQGIFRQRVADHEHACRITKVVNPVHLVASHIKPWRESDDEDRLDGGNGLLLTPSIDHLFDRGFISFEDDGGLIVSPEADHESLIKMGIDTRRPISVQEFNTDQKYFLNYHREEILLKPAI